MTSGTVTLSDGRLSIAHGITNRVVTITATDYQGRESRAVVGQIAFEIIVRALNESNPEYRADDFRQLANILEDTYRVQHGEYDS